MKDFGVPAHGLETSHQRYRIAAVLALVIALAVWFSQSKPALAHIRVVSARDFTRDGEPAVRVRLHVVPEDGRTDEMDFDIVAGGFFDTSTFAEKGNYRLNKTKTLVAFNVDQIDHIQIFLVLQGDGGQLLVIRNFGERVFNLCAKSHHYYNSDGDSVDKVVGNKVYVSCSGPDLTHNCFATVQVSPDGQLSLLSYQMKKSKN
ncbi:MAG TPA: hypothetical protein VFW40_13040 [Capsulimonadaceae bacterium]|nr:hypothetical protein [Capsulimonadaceae bacterium]